MTPSDIEVLYGLVEDIALVVSTLIERIAELQQVVLQQAQQLADSPGSDA